MSKKKPLSLDKPKAAPKGQSPLDEEPYFRVLEPPKTKVKK